MGVIFAEPWAPVEPPNSQHLAMWLESLDGSLRVDLSGGRVWRANGASGLGSPPEQLAVSSTPGVAGGSIDGVTTLTRPVMLPLAVVTDNREQAWQALGRLRALKRAALTGDGSMRLVCSGPAGTRELTVAYVSGLEGEETGVPEYTLIPLQLLAPDPFARDRVPRTVTYGLESSTVPTWPWTWPGALGSTTLLGQDMPIDVVSDVPVYPRIELVGPLPDLVVSSSTGMLMEVPAGVPAGSTLTVVTDPRAKSVRLDGALAAGRLTRASRIGRPFTPGRNLLSVASPGTTQESAVVVSWRGGWDSLW